MICCFIGYESGQWERTSLAKQAQDLTRDLVALRDDEKEKLPLKKTIYIYIYNID